MNFVVSAVSVPAAATTGAPVTINYTVKNTATVGETGSWTDALYLSKDGVWSLNDPLIAQVEHTGGIAAGGTYMGSVTAALPGVVPGGYQVIVRTNILSQSTGTNATGASGTNIAVSVPTLTFGTPAGGTLTTGQSAYYQFKVGAGETVDIAAASNNPLSINNLYVRFGDLPTLGQYDATSLNPSVANPDAVVRLTQPGTYYVLLVGNSVAGNETYTLNAHTVDFSISHITPDHGSNLGSVTLTIDGAKFNANEVVTVTGVDGTTRTATSVKWVGSTEVWATFDLRGLAVGSYGVSIGDGTQSASVAHGFSVNHGPAGVATVNLVLPQSLRAGQTGIVQVDYANTGETDIVSPVIDLSSANALISGVGIKGTTGEFNFLGTNMAGPTGILQPGATGSVTFSFTPVNPQPHRNIDFTAGVLQTSFPVEAGSTSQTPTDWTSTWAGLQNSLQPATVGNADWANVWHDFVGLVGTTSASVTNAISKVATELGQVGQATNDIDQLLRFELLQATGALAGTTLAKSVDIASTSSPFSLSLVRTYSGTLLDRTATGAFGQGWVSNYDVRAVADASGTVFVQSPTALHVFTLQANGTYAAQPGDASVLTASGGRYHMTDGTGASEQFRADGKLASMTDSNGNVVSLSYNGAGVLAQVVSQTTGETLTLASDAHGRITSAVSSRGTAVSYAYTGDDAQLIGVTGQAGTTSYSYVAATGSATDYALTAVANPNGTQQLFTYNAQGWLASRSNSDGSGLQKYAYDGAGRISVTDALGRSTTSLYGANGAVAQLQDALGNVTQVQSTATGLPTKTVSAGGSSTGAVYDASGNLTSFSDALGGSVKASYVPGTSHLDTLATQLGSQTHYSRDAAGNVVGITYQDGSGATYVYGSSGLLTSSTDANGVTTTLSYDASGNLTKRAFSDGTANTYTYDTRSNLLTATAPSGTNVYTYDAANRLTSLTDGAGRIEGYSYNGKGQLASRNLPDGSVSRYSYNSAGQLAQLQDGAGHALATYTYDAAGQLTGRLTGNGASTTYRYDAAGRETEILNRNADGTVASQYDYTYNANSRVVRTATTDGTWTYGYDAAGQLTAGTFASTDPGIASQALSYTYDGAGNRISQAINGITTAYAVNSLNQYTRVGGTTYLYDRKGNQIAKTDSTGTTNFTYDRDGHLVSTSGPGGTITFSYDAIGNIVSKNESGISTTYVNDPLSMIVGGQLLSSPAQVYGAGGKVLVTYGYGLGLTSVANSLGVSYVNSDLVGNVDGVSDTSGKIGPLVHFRPYGELSNANGSVNGSLGFAGLFGIENTGAGLLVMRARAYDPSLGRFTSPDPTGIKGGLNLYRFASNNPELNVDPTGQESFAGAGIGAAVGAAAGAVGGASYSAGQYLGEYC